MNEFPGVHSLAVHISSGGQNIKVGTLAWSRVNRRAVFEYDPAFLEQGHDLSPWHLRRPGSARQGLMAQAGPFDGLHGLFADSLPDGWGRYLTDRRLAETEIDHRSLTPLDRLSLIGSGGMGALVYSPETAFPRLDKSISPRLAQAGIDIDRIATEIETIQMAVDGTSGLVDLDELYGLHGGSSGARPKIMAHEMADGRLGTGEAGSMPQWLIKFPARDDDPWIGNVEAAYAMMAGHAGIQMPETRLFPSADRNSAVSGFFGARRFDRAMGSSGIAGRRLVHTAAGLAHADHRQPSFSYESLIAMTRHLTKDQLQVEEQFRRAAFNVLSSNRDDHTKNHAFLYDVPTKKWTLTPAYDLTPSAGMGGEHAMTIGGKGTSFDRSDLEVLATKARIGPKAAGEIIDQVIEAIMKWHDFAGVCRVPQAAAKNIGNLQQSRINPATKLPAMDFPPKKDGAGQLSSGNTRKNSRKRVPER